MEYNAFSEQVVFQKTMIQERHFWLLEFLPVDRKKENLVSKSYPDLSAGGQA